MAVTAFISGYLTPQSERDIFRKLGISVKRHRATELENATLKTNAP